MYIYIYIPRVRDDSKGRRTRETFHSREIHEIVFSLDTGRRYVSIASKRDDCPNCNPSATDILVPSREKGSLFSSRDVTLRSSHVQNASEGDEQVVNISHARVRTRTRQF